MVTSEDYVSYVGRMFRCKVLGNKTYSCVGVDLFYRGTSEGIRVRVKVWGRDVATMAANSTLDHLPPQGFEEFGTIDWM